MVGSWPNDAMIVVDYDTVCITGWCIDAGFRDGMVCDDRYNAPGLLSL